MEDEWKTRKTLIERARDPNDAQAWDEFASYYHSFIRMLLTKLQVPQNDVKDLSQDVLLELWECLPKMEPGRNGAKFRMSRPDPEKARTARQAYDDRVSNTLDSEQKKKWNSDGYSNAMGRSGGAQAFAVSSSTIRLGSRGDTKSDEKQGE